MNPKKVDDHPFHQPGEGRRWCREVESNIIQYALGASP